MIQEFQTLYPSYAEEDIFHAIASFASWQRRAVEMAETRAQASGADTFFFVFDWQAPAFDGRFKACHGIEIPFVFDNLDMASSLWEGAPRTAEDNSLAKQMTTLWTAFAGSASPNHDGLPSWAPFTSSSRVSMRFGRVSRTVVAPFHDEEAIWKRVVGG